MFQRLPFALVQLLRLLPSQVSGYPLAVHMLFLSLFKLSFFLRLAGVTIILWAMTEVHAFCCELHAVVPGRGAGGGVLGSFFPGCVQLAAQGYLCIYLIPSLNSSS